MQGGADHTRAEQRRSLAAAVGLMLLLLVGGAWSSPARGQGRALVVDAVNTLGRPDDGRTRLDLYTRVPYAALHFLRTARGFSAQYEVSIDAYRLSEGGERQYLAERRRLARTVAVDRFEATRSATRSDAAVQSMTLRPGTYQLVVRLDDPATEQTIRRAFTVTVRDLSSPVALSDVILLDDYDASTSTISPRVSSIFGTDAQVLQFFYEVYAEAPHEVRITHEIIRTHQGGGLPVLGALFGDDEDEGGKVTYTQAQTTTLDAGRTPRVVSIPLAGVPTGEYLVRTRLERPDGSLLAQVEERITVRWLGLDDHVRDLDAAIAQLRYIAKDEDLAYIRSGETEGERLRRFRAFWKKRDPTPDTERNERMEEYYYRVARANDHYGRRTAEGWLTDRGHVLVLFGTPDRIDRHPAGARPYEVWHYGRIDRRFIFVDEGGEGDYRLLEPIWDEHSRIR